MLFLLPAKRVICVLFRRFWGLLGIGRLYAMAETVVLRVAMSCQGCVGAVNRVLSKLEGVDSFEIELEKQKVTVKGNVKPDTVLQTVSKTGKKSAFWEEEEAKEPSPAAANASATE